MAVKPAKQMASELAQFIGNVRRSIQQLEDLQRRLETDATFRKAWESDSAKALRTVGINPDARMEVGRGAYERGPECTWCITPKGNACHC